MKKIVALAFGFCLMGGMAKAQTLDAKYGLDSAQTIENASIYNEFVKQKNYKDALPAWRYVFHNAPAFQMRTYSSGEDILAYMYQQTKNPAYIDTLMMLYDQRIKYFGNHPRYGEGYILGKKGADLVRFGKKDSQTQKEAYGYLSKSFEMEGVKSHPVTVQMLFFVAGDLLKSEDLSKDDYINLYMRVGSYIDEASKNSKKPESFMEMKERINGLFFNSGVADCETLNRLLSESFDAKPEDVENLKSISTLLRRYECVDLPLYAKVAEKLYSLDPTADAAYSLAMMFLKRQEFDKTETYLKEAIDKAEDSDPSKADYYMWMAKVKQAKKQYVAAKANLLEVLKLNPKSGQAYIMLGRTYASYAPQYGEDAFDHASVYWLAVDKFMKAKQVDPYVAEEANKLIGDYSPHFPSKEEAFFRSISEGSTVKIGDWINESTVARFRK